MLTRLFFCFFIILLSSCSLLPGIQNPDISQMRQVHTRTQRTMPTLIPITPELIADQHISTYMYRVAAADILNISVWQHPEFSLQEFHVSSQNSNLPSKQGAAGEDGFLVNPAGFIYFPLIGNVFVEGKTVDTIRRDMTSRLKKYIKDPSLNVRVVEFRSRKVYVLGEVRRPGFIPLTDQALSVTDAITLTGGMDPNAADPSHIYVIRGAISRPNMYWLDAKSPEALLLAEHFFLMPNDILFVSSAPATRWNRVLNQLLPTIQTVWYTKAIIDTNH